MTADDAAGAPVLSIDFCGEITRLDVERRFAIGRDADLTVDENPYLHRRFLEVSFHDGLWWLANTGSQLSATVSDDDSRVQAWLAPGAHLPIAFGLTMVRFT